MTDCPCRRPLLALWLLAGTLLCGSPGAWGASAREACSGPTLRVAIDVGHSRRAPGAISATGRAEYYFNDRFARELVARSRRTEAARLDLFIVNPDGEELSLPQRPELARRNGANVFISIHHDSAHRKYLKPYLLGSRLHYHTPGIHGFSLFVSRANPRFEDSRRLAHLVGTSFRIAGMQPTLHHAEDLANERREVLEGRIGLYEAPFVVLRSAHIPALLIEVGVIANRAEETDLERPEVRGRVQLALMEALGAFCDGGVHARIH